MLDFFFLIDSPPSLWFKKKVLASSAIPPNAFKNLPPFPQRAGFSLIMFGAGYVTSTGDVSNGSGISTGKLPPPLFFSGIIKYENERKEKHVTLSNFILPPLSLVLNLSFLEWKTLIDSSAKSGLVIPYWSDSTLHGSIWN